MGRLLLDSTEDLRLVAPPVRRRRGGGDLDWCCEPRGSFPPGGSGDAPGATGGWMQRLDTGVGLNSGLYTMQPLFSPAVSYNTQFPQLESGHKAQIPVDLQTWSMLSPTWTSAIAFSTYCSQLWSFGSS